MPADALVTIALPVYNGAGRIESVARSVLDQDHGNIEFLIADNASTDSTEQICREIASSDPRVRYHRQPSNIGLVNNFMWTKQNCRGQFLRWIGDNDEIQPDYVSRCLEQFAEDDRLILVTTGMEYLTEDGGVESARFDGAAPLRSADPVTRLSAMIDLLTDTYLLIDPMYGLARTAAVRNLVQHNILRGDEVYAAELALAGPWAHLPQVLARRNWKLTRPKQAANLLNVPMWQSRVTMAIEAKNLLGVVDGAALSAAQRRAARAIVARHYVRRHRARLARGLVKARARLHAAS